MKKQFIIREAPNPSRQNAILAVQSAEVGMVVEIKPATRNLEQSAKFHAICGDFEKSGIEWAGKKRDAAAWKVLLVSGHAIATGLGAEMVPGLESEFVNIRESTAKMSKGRASSLIEYAIAMATDMGVRLSDGVLR